MEQQKEIECIRRIVEGETEQFSYFLQRYSRPIHSMILRIIPCREDAEELTDVMKKLEQAIELLNTEERALIALYYMDEKAIIEVASILQLTPDNVKVKLYRVRKKIYALVKNGKR